MCVAPYMHRLCATRAPPALTCAPSHTDQCWHAPFLTARRTLDAVEDDAQCVQKISTRPATRADVNELQVRAHAGGTSWRRAFPAHCTLLHALPRCQAARLTLVSSHPPHV